MWQFISIFFLNIFGDLLVVMTLPVYIIDQTKSFRAGSAFTIIVFTSILLTAKIAGKMTTRWNPLTLVATFDSVQVVLVFCLYIILLIYGFNLALFLTCCGILALIINIPMYAKFNLIHRAFVPDSEMQQFSWLQGRINGFAFIFAVLLSGFLYTKIGFENILLIDMISFIPCIVLLWKYRNHVTAPEKEFNAVQSQDAMRFSSFFDNDFAGTALLYQMFFLISFQAFIQNLRSHLVLSMFKVTFLNDSFLYLCTMAALGVAFSFFLSPLHNHLYRKYPMRQVDFLGAMLLAIGLILHSPLPNGLKVLTVSFLLNEFIALILAKVRKAHLDSSKYYPVKTIVTFGLIISSIFTIFGVFIFSEIGSRFDFGSSFLFFSFLFCALLFFLRRKVRFNHKITLLGLSLLLMCATETSFARFEYITAMSDQPRLLGTLAGEILTEDESFLRTNIMCPLLKRNANGNLVAELAERWNIILPDQEIAFKIRPWRDSDGTQITALYIKQSLERQIQKIMKDGKSLRGYQYLKGISKCNETSCAITGIEVKDENILIISLTKPWPDLLSLLEGTFFIYHIKKMNEFAVPVSCGKYKVSFLSSEKIILEKNKFRLDLSSTAPDAVQIRIREPDLAYKDFCQGSIFDLYFYMPSRNDLYERGCKDTDFDYKEVYSTGFWYINLSKSKHLTMKQIKKLRDNFDSTLFRKTWDLTASPQHILIPREFGFPANQREDQAPSKAKSGKVKEKIKILCRYIKGTPNPKQLEHALRTWVNNSDFDLQIVPTAFSEFFDDFDKRKSDIYVFAEVANSENPIDFLATFFQASSQKLDGPEKSSIEDLWGIYIRNNSQENLLKVERAFRKTGLFFPLFSFKRPVVKSKKYGIKFYSDFGLFNLEIDNFFRNDL